MRSFAVHLTPNLTTPDELAGGTVVVIDVLRASTTIVHALAAGATAVIPCLEIDEARQLAARFSPDRVILGGERGGLKIDGFDLGNSPSEYTLERVGGKTVVFTTTNGTRAMQMCHRAARVLIGAAVNRQAVAERLQFCAKVHLLCAGTDGRISSEDVLAAGLIGQCAAPDQIERNDEAELAVLASRALCEGGRERLAAAFAHSRGGKNLIALGSRSDIVTAAQLDQSAIVPELDLATWRITAG
ncbi:MAG TPA: 2-phosphosulfolactate phosphatase [Pirellulales bacterium]|jgi:2-phosphosulfolactate phosphatase|nr:2-phosphosulfolactate phosphatase [Pirellulales bacterium]